VKCLSSYATKNCLKQLARTKLAPYPNGKPHKIKPNKKEISHKAGIVGDNEECDANQCEIKVINSIT